MVYQYIIIIIIYTMYTIYIFNFVTHGLFMKDDSFKEGVQLHPFHAHVLSIKKKYKK